MIYFGYRINFLGGEVDQGSYVCSLPNNFIEWALPYKYTEYVDLYKDGTIRKIANFLASNSSFKVLSVKATHGRISDKSSLLWLLESSILASFVGCKWVIVSPNRIGNDLDAKANAIRNIGLLNALDCEQKVAVESYSSKSRVLSVSDIINYKFPMALNTGYVEDHDSAVKIIRRYSYNIPVVHLSARVDGNPHHRLNDECCEIVTELLDQDWNGSVILDYLPKFNRYLEEDCLRLVEFLQSRK